MIKLFNDTDKDFSTNGEVIINPSYAVVHKEDNGDYYLDLETPLKNETKIIASEAGETATINGTGQITADGTKESRLLTLKGDTQQDSTTGQQLFNYKDQYDVNQLYTIDNDGWISATYNNTGSSTVFLHYYTHNLNLQTSTNYITMLEVKNVSGNASIYISTTHSSSQSNSNIYRTFSSLTNGGTYKNNITTVSDFSETTNGIRSYLRFGAGQSGSITFRLSVLADTSITPETFKYEPYTNGASPNPDYPQPINVVTGRQEIDICGKNLLNKEIYELGKFIGANGVITSNAQNFLFSDYSIVSPNTEYTISANTEMKNFVIAEYNSSKTWLKNTIKSLVQSSSFTTDNNTKYVRVSCNYNYQTITKEIIDTLNIQLEKGNQSSAYEPYTSQNYEINLGKNLFNSSIQAGTYASAVYTVDSDGKINQSASDSSQWEISATRNFTLPKGTYTFSVIGKNANTTLQVRNLTDNNDLISTTNNVTTVTLTDTKTLGIKTHGEDEYFPQSYYIQIEKGTQATSYSKYFEPIELCKIENQDHTVKYQDSIFHNTTDTNLDLNSWYIKKEIGSVTFTGANEENWVGMTFGNYYRVSISISDINVLTVNDINLYSQYFYGNNSALDSASCELGMMSHYKNSKNVYFITNETNTSNFKTWLSTHNTKVKYVLSTPTYTKITNTELIGQLESVRLLNGLNNVTITGSDLAPPIEMLYNHVTGGEVSTDDYIQPNRILVANTPTGDQAFRITDIEKRKHKIVLKAWHISYDTQNYVIQDSYVVDKDCNQAMDYLNNATDNESPFTTASNITTIDSYRCVRKSLFEAFSTIRERWGGHFVRDNWQFKIMNSIGQDNGVVVRYAKNLKDITVQYDWNNVVTKILPVGNDGLLLDEVFLYADYQYDIPYTKVVHFNQEIDVDDFREDDGSINEDAYIQALKTDLANQALRYLQENHIPQVNYELNANLEKITDVGDTILVKDERLGIDILTNLIAYDYDCILEKYKTLEFGNFTKQISELTDYIDSQTTIKANESMQTTRIILEDELQTATSQIWGVLGNSYVIYEGDKILIVDSLPKESATNVIMLNAGGIGFSNTGINGTFTSAWTIDNVLNMQNINVINLTADLIKGGTLKLGSNLNQNGTLEVYDEANNQIAVINKDGIRMNATDGGYILINTTVGFAGFDRNNTKIYWADGDEFHMKKSVVEEEITLVDKMRIIPITIMNGSTVVNDGIGFVSTL